VEYRQKSIGIKTESSEKVDRTGSLTWEVQVKVELLLDSLLFNISSLLVVLVAKASMGISILTDRDLNKPLNPNTNLWHETCLLI